MAQRERQKKGQNQGQGRTQPGANGANGRARANGAGAVAVDRATVAGTFTAETAREERARATGRRARQRAAQEQAARRRRLGVIIGVVTAVVVVAIIIGAFALHGSNSSAAGLTANDTKLNPSAPLAVGKAAPDFNLATVDGKRYKLSALRGRPVLLEYFAVWCPHCQHEAPILNQLDKSYASKRLQSLSILASPYDKTHEATGSTNPVTKDDISWFKSTFAVQHPILIDPDFTTVNQYGVSGYPSIYILDKNGVVRYSNNGFAEPSYQTLAKAVDAAVKDQSTK